MKKALVIRLGAYGDMLIITPVLRKLKEQGYEVIVNTSKRGLDVLKHDSNVDDFIEYVDDSIAIDKIHDYWATQRKHIDPNYYCNFSGSIEHNLSLHPTDPLYVYPKWERAEVCNKNYYEETMRWAKLDWKSESELKPLLYFTDEEIEQARGYLKQDQFNILWSMSGSGKNKVYPWTEYVIGQILNDYKNVHIITVGDLKCQLIESHEKSITNLSGKVNIRLSMCLTQYTDLVISPDTGILHASGAYSTPKIGLLGPTTKENITKHFENDHSIESKCACAPCFHLNYDYETQCPVDIVTKSAWCMMSLEPERVYEEIKGCIPDSYRK